MSMTRLAVAVSITALALIGCGSEDAEPSPASAPLLITVRGDLALTQELASDAILRQQSTCYGTKGYDDIHGGAQVVVYDAAGVVLGVGKLDSGIWDYSVDGYYRPCKLSFTIIGVPAQDLYQIEVTRRGKIVVSRAQAESGNVHLTLGNN
ncbi:hypothetical protein EV193_11033 [Herbihabitans rhizosphaerae]|uniref:Lipoprotein n=1 Tax=Herbihabitans rhizosphaerae TaxID=1872711 RepID=A0A4Q7KFA7_9PSEU|nr:hypothetical protein [Herbihabitans rhizosphaerae]RZS33883.1 hypothetical protein EV193_11033 [Herbihabitans rhizosphaerae]